MNRVRVFGAAIALLLIVPCAGAAQSVSCNGARCSGSPIFAVQGDELRLRTVHGPLALRLSPSARIDVTSPAMEIRSDSEVEILEADLAVRGRLAVSAPRVSIKDAPDRAVKLEAAEVTIESGEIDIDALTNAASRLATGGPFRLRGASPVVLDARVFAGEVIVEDSLGRPANVISKRDPIVLSAGPLREPVPCSRSRSRRPRRSR